MLGERLCDLLGEACVREVPARHVDREIELQPCISPAANLLERLVEHIPGQVAHETALLGRGEERVGPEEAARGVSPANQRLGAAHDTRPEVDLWLVVDDELGPLDRTA